jgi:hypothetical protein
MPERIKRPKLERTDPVRNWSTLLGLGSAGTAGSPGGTALNDVIARSVDLGYRVIDEYVRQGQRAAERLSAGSFPDPAAATNEFQEISARMAQYSSDLMSLWFQMVGAAMANGGVTPAARPVPPPASVATPTTAASGANGEAVRVRVEVASVQPVEVALDLRPGAGRAPLLVHTLRAVDPDKPALTASALPDGDEGIVRLRVQVPDDHPAGVYSGLLVDQRTSLPVGALSLRVGRA